MSDLVASAHTMDLLDKIRPLLAEGKVVDISRDPLSKHFDVPRESLQAIVLILDDEGYPIHFIQIPHEDLPGKKRTLRVVSPKSYSFVHVLNNLHLITSLIK